MRTISSALQQAMENKGSYSPSLRITFYRTRSFFDASAIADNSPTWAQAAGVNDQPVPQDGRIHAAGFVTVANNGGALVGLLEGSATVSNLGISSPVHARPAVSPGYIYYIDVSGNLQRVTWGVQTGQVALTGTPEQIASVSANASVHAISDTEIAVFVLDNGGVRATIYKYANGVWQSSAMPGRFIQPNKLVVDPYWLNFSAAASLGGAYFVYMTMPDGSVRSCKCDATSMEWQVTRTALAADLSDCRITNALAYNGQIFVSAQFARTKELNTGSISNLILRSTNGDVLIFEPQMLVSRTGYRFIVSVDASGIHLSDTNRTATLPLNYYTGGADTLVVTESDILDISLEDDDGAAGKASLTLKSGAEQYIDNALLSEGNIFEVEIGYSGQLVRYGLYVITGSVESYGDAERNHYIEGMRNGMWRITNTPMPLYSEIVGRSFVLDDISELDNLYAAPGSNIGLDFVSVDFWDCEPFSPDATVAGIDLTDENGVPVPYEAVGAHKYGFKSTDLADTLYSDYPTALGDVQVEVYGWSRTKAAGHENDHITAYLIVERASSGDEETVVCQAVDGDQWPLHAYDTVSRQYPVKFSCALNSGDKIKSVGLVLEAQNDTIALPARADLRNIQFSPGAYSQAIPWNVKDGYAELPSAGVPHVMFSVRPYSTEQFDVYATFERYLGSTPSRWRTYAGLVGMGADGKNYIVARYCWQTNTIEIAKVRQNSITVLASTVLKFSIGTSVTMRFAHRDGVFSVSVLSAGSWSPPVLEYEWAETDPPSTSDTGVMHTGVYGYVEAPSFPILTNGGDTSPCIAIMPGQNARVLDAFPDTGKVEIDGIVYRYDGKTRIARYSEYLFETGGVGPYPAYGISVDDVEIGIDVKQTAAGPSRYIHNNNFGIGILSYDGDTVVVGTDGLYALRVLDGKVRFFSSGLDRYSLVDEGAKIVIAHGLLNITPDTEKSASHGEWAICSAYTTERVRLRKFAATNLTETISIGDILQSIGAVVGVDIELAGDRTSTQAVDSNGVVV